jgi:hypothetical protein
VTSLSIVAKHQSVIDSQGELVAPNKFKAMPPTIKALAILGENEDPSASIPRSGFSR